MENPLEPSMDGTGKEDAMPFAQEEGAPVAPASDEAAAATEPQAPIQSSPDAAQDDAASANAGQAHDSADAPDAAESPDAADAADASDEARAPAGEAESESAEDLEAEQDSLDEEDARAADAESDPDAENKPQAAPSGPAAREAETAATVEAVLFAADSPLPAAKVAQIARLPLKAVRAAIGALNDRYHQVGAAFRIEEIAGGFQMLTLGQYRDVLERLHSARSDSRLTQAALETLAIVAYRQPVLRADIESIRGVACGDVLRGLMEKQLIHIAGRAQILGRPLLYGTTRRFLELFGLANLEDLPKAEELRAPAQKLAPETPAAPEMQAATEAPASTGTPDTATAPAADTQATPIVAAPDGQYISDPQPAPAPSPSSIA